MLEPVGAAGVSGAPLAFGIAPRDVPGFLMAELLGALAAAYFFHWLSEGTVMLSKAKKVDYTGWDKVAEPTLSLVHSTANVRFGSLGDIMGVVKKRPLYPWEQTFSAPVSDVR